MAEPLRWRQIDWHRPLDPGRVVELLRHWAADARGPRLVVETRFRAGDVQHLLGHRMGGAVTAPLTAMPNSTLRAPDRERLAVLLAGRLCATTRRA